MFMVDDQYQIKQPTSQFFAAQLITQEWVEPRDADHHLFRAVTDVKDSDGNTLVTAYPVQRPDSQWSIMLINKDYDNPHQVRIVFHDAGHDQDESLIGPVTFITFGKHQYQWHPDRKQGYADPDGPPIRAELTGTKETLYTLPPASLVVLRGRVGRPQE